MSYKDIQSMPQTGQFIQIWKTGNINPHIFAERYRWINDQLWAYEPNGNAEILNERFDYPIWDEEWYQYDDDLKGVCEHREREYNAVYVILNKEA